MQSNLHAPEPSHALSIPVVPPRQTAGFNYDDLDPALALEAHDAAQRIRSRCRTQGVTLIEIGRDLQSIKDRLLHGQFCAWLKGEFGWHERSAQRYMRVAEIFGAKTDIVSDLPTTVLHQLAAPSTPPTVREKVLARAEAGEQLKPSAIASLVREAKRRADNRVQSKPASSLTITVISEAGPLRSIPLTLSAEEAAAATTVLGRMDFGNRFHVLGSLMQVLERPERAMRKSQQRTKSAPADR